MAAKIIETIGIVDHKYTKISRFDNSYTSRPDMCRVGSMHQISKIINLVA